jgi:signal transduction histidine kinase
MIIFFIGAVTGINYINIDEIRKLPIINNINSINFLIGLICIPCCWLYYYMYKNNDFFILTLSYTSIWIEYIATNFVKEELLLQKYILIFPFLFRVILLTIVIINKGKISLVDIIKRFAIFITMLINILGLIVEVYIKSNIEINSFMQLFKIFEIIIIIYYCILLTILAKRAFLNSEFIYIIFVESIGLFTLRRVTYFNFFKNDFKDIIQYNRYIAFIGFFILLIGLYIEVIRKIKHSEKLNNQIAKSEQVILTIREDIRVIKEVENIRNQFFANISHEFKTPINIIFSCVQLLEKKIDNHKELVETYKKYDSTIKQNCYRMLRLINNLVDITKLDSGYMRVDFQNCDIVNLVEEITLSIVPYVDNKNIRVVFDTFIEELQIKCDPDSIERIMLNLLSNAVKFTPNGGNILVCMDADDDWVVIKVVDDGIGINSDVKNVIFERFVQGDKSLKREKEGSGIGLALVKSLVELHEGCVCLGENTERGSEFIVKLPNVKVEEIKREDVNIDVDSKPIVEKINIEFSDIYELY